MPRSGQRLCLTGRRTALKTWGVENIRRRFEAHVPRMAYRTSVANRTSSSPKRFNKLLSPEVEIMQNLCKPSPELQSINRLRSKIGDSAASSALIIHHAGSPGM